MDIVGKSQKRKPGLPINIHKFVPPSQVIREMQIKPQWLYEFIPISLDKLRFLKYYCLVVEQWEHTTGGVGVWVIITSLGSSVMWLQLKMCMHFFHPSVPLLDIDLELLEGFTHMYKGSCVGLSIPAFAIVKIWMQRK